MPLYEYECPECGTEFEQLVPFQQADDAVCPTCQRPRVKRKIARIAARQPAEGGAGDSGGASCSPGGG